MPDSDCRHSKLLITLDSGDVVCPICDDVDIQTLDTESGAI